jgi:hypothetical protein
MGARAKRRKKKIGATYRTSLRLRFKKKSSGEEVESDTRTTQNYLVFIMVDFAVKKICRHVLPSRTRCLDLAIRYKKPVVYRGFNTLRRISQIDCVLSIDYIGHIYYFRPGTV